MAAVNIGSEKCILWLLGDGARREAAPTGAPLPRALPSFGRAPVNSGDSFYFSQSLTWLITKVRVHHSLSRVRSWDRTCLPPPSPLFLPSLFHHL